MTKKALKIVGIIAIVLVAITFIYMTVVGYTSYVYMQGYNDAMKARFIHDSQ